MVGFARIMGPVIIVNVHQDTMETIARKVSVVSIGWYGEDGWCGRGATPHCWVKNATTGLTMHGQKNKRLSLYS
jgi:hypothetical protein